MKVLITGGAGYVGNALIQQLIEDKNIELIKIYDNLSKGRNVLLQPRVKSPKIQFIEGDILDNYKLKKALKDVDTVVHLATVKEPSSHHYMEQVNHWGTANLLNLIEENPIKRFVFLSTTEVYDTKEIKLITAENPQTPYANSMLRAENYVKTLSHKCEVTIVRTPTIYGYNPAMDFSYGLNKHIFEAKYNNLLQLDADGLHTQSAVHITDLATLLSYITRNTPSQPLYLANSEHWNGMEIYEKLKNYFPNLEATFTGHHLRLPDHSVEMDTETSNIIKNKITLAKAIEEILSQTNY